MLCSPLSYTYNDYQCLFPHGGIANMNQINVIIFYHRPCLQKSINSMSSLHLPPSRLIVFHLVYHASTCLFDTYEDCLWQLYHSSTMGATLTFSLMISFLILSYLMRQLIRYNIVIFATLKLLSYWLFNIQDSIPHNNAGLIAIHFNHKWHLKYSSISSILRTSY